MIPLQKIIRTTKIFFKLSVFNLFQGGGLPLLNNPMFGGDLMQRMQMMTAL